jgi:hypothetical protein
VVMVRAGFAPDAVRAYPSGSTFRHVDKVVHTATWRLEGADSELLTRAAGYILAKERSLGVPDPRDGAEVVPVLTYSRGKTAYGEPMALVVCYRFERPRCFAKRAALPATGGNND